MNILRKVYDWWRLSKAPWAGSDAGLATVPPAGYKRATNRRPIEALPIRAA
jgi:hypothetical protein